MPPQVSGGALQLSPAGGAAQARMIRSDPTQMDVCLRRGHRPRPRAVSRHGLRGYRVGGLVARGWICLDVLMLAGGESRGGVVQISPTGLSL